MYSSQLIGELREIVTRYEDIEEPDIQNILSILEHIIYVSGVGVEILSAFAELVQWEMFDMIYQRLMHKISTDLPAAEQGRMEAILKRLHEKIDAEETGSDDHSFC